MGGTIPDDSPGRPGGKVVRAFSDYLQDAEVLRSIETALGQMLQAEQDSSEYSRAEDEQGQPRSYAKYGAHLLACRRFLDLAARGLLRPEPEPDGNARVSCAQIAKILGLGKNGHGAIQQRLRRFREQHAEGWVETNESAKNKPGFLYEWGKVKSCVQGVLPVPVASHSQE